MSEGEFQCKRESLEEVAKRYPKMLLIVEKDGCPGCEYANRLISETELKIDGLANLKVDSEECSRFASELGVVEVPTLIEFKDGKEKRRISLTGNPESDKTLLKSVGTE